jgi:hypothetical protein
VRRIAAEHVMSCYVVWNFAQNKEGAKQFLVDFMDSFSDAFKGSEFYDFPCFPATVPNLKELIANDAKDGPCHYDRLRITSCSRRRRSSARAPQSTRLATRPDRSPPHPPLP